MNLVQSKEMLTISYKWHSDQGTKEVEFIVFTEGTWIPNSYSQKNAMTIGYKHV